MSSGEVLWGSRVETIASIVDHTATVAALIAGAVWAVRRYKRQRVQFSRARTGIACTPIRIPDGWILQVEVSIENIGNELLAIDGTELRLRQIVPLPVSVTALAADGADLVSEGEQAILWPCLAQRNWEGASREMKIEPGETDVLITDFFVPRDVTAVQLYLFVPNMASKQPKIGWTSTIVYVLDQHAKGQS